MFKTGMSKSVFNRVVDFAVDTKIEPAPGGIYIACHLGGGDPGRHIDLPVHSREECQYVCLGGKNDPLGENMIDARGCSLMASCKVMLGAKSVVGSDSLFTHLSGVLGVETLCMHNGGLSYLISNRRIYARGRSSITL